MSVSYTLVLRKVPAWIRKDVPEPPATERPADPDYHATEFPGYLHRDEYIRDTYKMQEQWDKDNRDWLYYQASYLVVEWGSEDFRWRIEHIPTGDARLVTEEDLISNLQDMIDMWGVVEGDVGLHFGQFESTVQKEIHTLIYTDQTGLQIGLSDDYEYDLVVDDEYEYRTVLDTATNKLRLVYEHRYKSVASQPNIRTDLTGVQYLVV